MKSCINTSFIHHSKYFACLFFLFFTSCVCSRYYAITGYDYRKITTYQADSVAFDISSLTYRKICDGIEIARLENERLPLIATIIKVSFKNEALKIVATEEGRFRGNFVKPETTFSFAKRFNTNIAINANFFTYRCSVFDPLYKPLGLFIERGKIVSKYNKDFVSVYFGKNKEISVDLERDQDAYFAIAGFNKVIERGKVILRGKSTKTDSRTLLGVDKEENTLFILCIDGEVKKRSRGASLIEATRLLYALGAFEAIELDGGGSSTIVAKIDSVQQQLVPSSKKQLRKVAINLGFIVE